MSLACRTGFGSLPTLTPRLRQPCKHLPLVSHSVTRPRTEPYNPWTELQQALQA